MADGSPRIGFRPLTGADLPMLGQWMERPHWRQWWGEPQVELALVGDMVEGRDATRPFLILLDGEPAGYIQVWFIDRHQDPPWTEDHPWLAELPPETVGVDLSLAEENMLSRGIGSAALRAFVGKLLAQGHGRIIIDPDPNNGRAVRAYEKAGFRPIPQLLGRTGDVLIMQYEGPNA